MVVRTSLVAALLLHCPAEAQEAPWWLARGAPPGAAKLSGASGPLPGAAPRRELAAQPWRGWQVSGVSLAAPGRDTAAAGGWTPGAWRWADARAAALSSAPGGGVLADAVVRTVQAPRLERPGAARDGEAWDAFGVWFLHGNVSTATAAALPGRIAADPGGGVHVSLQARF